MMVFLERHLDLPYSHKYVLQSLVYCTAKFSVNMRRRISRRFFYVGFFDISKFKISLCYYYQILIIWRG